MGFLSLDDPYGDEEVPPMPCFEGDNDDDRPFAPPADEYPIGCEVELRDVAFAKIAQTPEKWETFMDQIFSIHRRRVIVRRHLGEYSFVVCSDEKGFELVGMTLYRACLSEPKVKMTKYYFSADKETPNKLMEMMNDDTDLREELQREIHPSSESDAAFHVSRTPAEEAKIALTEANVKRAASVFDKKGMVEIKAPAVTNNLNTVHRRNNFAIAMKFGTRELGRQNYTKAIRYYNFALKEAPEEEVRVLCSRCVAYWHLQETELALKDAQRAIELQPDNHIGYVRAGNILRGRKEFEQAKKFYQKALERSPSDTKLQKLYADNCVAMLYDLRTKKFPYLKVTHHEIYKRAVVVSTQKVPAKATLLVETTSLTYIVPSKRASSKGCGHCCQSFLDSSMVTKEMPDIQIELLNRLCPPITPVCCRFCNFQYCSDKCRTRAWAEHHWVECRTRGLWRRGLREMDEYFEKCVDENEELPTDTISNINLTCIAACCYIAVRMMARMSSCVLALSEAVEMYNWLQISPTVVSRRAEVSDTLHVCFGFLKKGFSGESQQLLTYELFEKCYEQAKTNALGLFISPWESIRRKAHGELILVRESPLESSHSSSIPQAAQAHEQALQTIVHAPLQGPPGAYLYTLCVFELQALTWKHAEFPNTEGSGLASGSAQLKETNAPNIEIKSILCSSASIYLRSTNELERGTILSCASPASLYKL